MQNLNVLASLCSWAGWFELYQVTNLKDRFSCDKAHLMLPVKDKASFFINSFLASGKFCQLLITFVNSLDPDQDWHHVGPDLNPNHLTLEKINLKKTQQMTTKITQLALILFD